MPVVNWRSSAAAVRWNISPFINGRYRQSTSDACFYTVNPATEATLCEVGVGSADDINVAVDVARSRFEDGSWSGLPTIHRAKVLMNLADLIVRHTTELALLDTLEMGKPISSAVSETEAMAPNLLRSWAGYTDKLFGISAPLIGANVAFSSYEPRGVVGAISPWNFPLVNAVYKLGPALAAGNTLVLKPSEVSPSSALRLAELALEAGVPEGVFNVVPGLGATVGATLAQHPKVAMLSFTGSTATSRKIMEMSARSNGKPLLMECGGKSPQLVFEDANDLDVVAEAAVQSFLRNQGQVCSAHTRLLVQESIREALIERVVAKASKYSPCDPLEESTTFGPLANRAQSNRVKGYIDAGLTSGARAVLKGEIQASGGCNVYPTVFDRVEPTMSIAREEIFGPVLCVQSFSNEEEAIELSNETDYGLSATVWTRNLGRATRLVRSIKAGTISVRTSGDETADSGCMLGYEPQKGSGFGAELGLPGIQSYSTLKCVRFRGA